MAKNKPIIDNIETTSIADVSREPSYRLVFFDLIKEAAPAEQELLARHFAFQESLTSIAENHGITKRTVSARLQTALENADTDRRALAWVGKNWMQLPIFGG